MGRENSQNLNRFKSAFFIVQRNNSGVKIIFTETLQK